MEFNSTNLPQNISAGLYNDQSYDYDAIHVDKLFYTLFYSVSYILREIKSKDHPVAFVITDIKDNEIAAAIVEYFEGEEDNPGNWSLVWTFNMDDIPANAEKKTLQNDLYHPHFKAVAGEKYGMAFIDRTAIIVLMTYIVEQLYKWLDENAKENEVVEITLDGVFTAKVEVVDGKKEFAIIPAGEVKTIIKDDLAIEK